MHPGEKKLIREVSKLSKTRAVKMRAYSFAMEAFVGKYMDCINISGGCLFLGYSEFLKGIYHIVIVIKLSSL